MKFTVLVTALAAAMITMRIAAQIVPNPSSIDGVGNNLANPAWGSAGTALLRLAPAGYSDGIFAPALSNNLSARLISNVLNNQAETNNAAQDIATIDQNSLSDFGYAFGQFIDHDMDLTPDGGASFPIPVPPDDPIGPQPLPFTRSLIDPLTGINSPAEQLNMVTSYLDLSQVYGSSQVVADALRTFTGGLLKTSPGNMLPYDNLNYFTADQITALNMANDAQAVPESELFAAGDVRGNENLELTALETLFVRNHNLLANALQGRHPGWADEQLFQEARKLNIAGYQSIIYNEWLPAVFGSRALSPYSGYDASINAAIANEFSTAAFRFGHSMLSADIERKGNDGRDVAPSVSLALDFFNPHLLNPAGVVDPLTGLISTDIGPILKAQSGGNGQAMDLLAVSDIRNLLFGNAGLGGDDLMARDIQRGRDNGIPDYNTVRLAIGLPAAASFNDIVNPGRTRGGQWSGGADLQVSHELALAYPGGVGTVDLFEGGLSEHHLAGSDVGPTFQAIMVDQFERLRDGDRFFYLNQSFTSEETSLFQQVNSLAKVIMANTDVINLQSNVMFFRATISGTVSVSQAGPQSSPSGGAPTITVELKNEDGDLVARTTTDQAGQFSFNQLSGRSAGRAIAPGVSATGVYSVILVLPRGLRQVSTSPGPILISRGDVQVADVNFAVVSSQVGHNPGQHERR